MLFRSRVLVKVEAKLKECEEEELNDMWKELFGWSGSKGTAGIIGEGEGRSETVEPSPP